MKRIAAALLIVSLLALCGCSLFGKTEVAPETEEKEVQLVNPMVEYGSLEELNERTGAKFYRTGDADVTDEQYFIIGDEIADYRFTVAGVSYVWRFSQQTEMDISGVYTVGGTAFAEQLDQTELTFAEGDELAARWRNAEGQYTLSVEGGEMDAEAFRLIAEELSLVTKAE